MKITIFGKEINVIWLVFTLISISIIILAHITSLPPPNQIDPIIGIWKYETPENVTTLTFDGINNFESKYYSKIVYEDYQNLRGYWKKESNNNYNITFAVHELGVGHVTFVYDPSTESIYGTGMPDHLFTRVRG